MAVRGSFFSFIPCLNRVGRAWAQLFSSSRAFVVLHPLPHNNIQTHQHLSHNTTMSEDTERTQILSQYRAKIREHRETEARLKRLRLDVSSLVARYQKTEDDLTALQSVGQIIGDVLKKLDEDRFIVKASSGPRYVVGCRARLNRTKLKPGTRVALDMTTLTIMRILPREVDPTVFHMQSTEEEGDKKVSFSDIGGLNEQIRELREVIELPLTNPELFIRVGIKAPKGVLLYGPPGTGEL